MLSSAGEDWKAGDTFHVPSLKHIEDHLWVILTIPSGVNGDFLAVNMSSVKKGIPKDAGCILQPGEHSFVKTQTEMRYDQMREMALHGPKGILHAVANNLIARHQPLAPTILKRIQQGTIKSRFTIERYKALMRQEIESFKNAE